MYTQVYYYLKCIRNISLVDNTPGVLGLCSVRKQVSTAEHSGLLRYIWRCLIFFFPYKGENKTKLLIMLYKHLLAQLMEDWPCQLT